MKRQGLREADCHPLHKQPSSSGFGGTELLQFPVSIEVPRYRNVIQCLRACSLHLDVKPPTIQGAAKLKRRRLASGYSERKLATLDELESLVDKSANVPGRVDNTEERLLVSVATVM